MAKNFIYLPLTLGMVATQAHAGNCWDLAAKKHGVDAWLLVSIASVESSLKEGIRSKNSNGSYDLGIMQVNTIHLPLFAKMGYSEHQLQHDSCTNIMAGAYLLKQSLNKYGYNIDGIGGYHSNTPSKRRSYGQKVIDRYKVIVSKYYAPHPMAQNKATPANAIPSHNTKVAKIQTAPKTASNGNPAPKNADPIAQWVKNKDQSKKMLADRAKNGQEGKPKNKEKPKEAVKADNKRTLASKKTEPLAKKPDIKSKGDKKVQVAVVKKEKAHRNSTKDKVVSVKNKAHKTLAKSLVVSHKVKTVKISPLKPVSFKARAKRVKNVHI